VGGGGGVKPRKPIPVGPASAHISKAKASLPRFNSIILKIVA